MMPDADPGFLVCVRVCVWGGRIADRRFLAIMSVCRGPPANYI